MLTSGHFTLLYLYEISGSRDRLIVTTTANNSITLWRLYGGVLILWAAVQQVEGLKSAGNRKSKRSKL